MQVKPCCDSDGMIAARPRLTAEIFVIPLVAQRYLIYAPLQRTAFIANTSLVNLLSDLREGIDRSADLDSIEFLRGLGLVDGEPVARPITKFSGPPKPTNLTLFMTTGCNLRCTYCYASAGDKPTRGMSLETACRGIDFV